MVEQNKIYLGNCLDIMQGIESKAIDMVLCDLPYGCTDCDFDNRIDLKELWQQYERIIKDNGAIVLFGTQPFGSELIMSNRKLFRYELIWNKVNIGNPMNAKKMPLSCHENILVFYKKLPTYNPQMTDLDSIREWKQYSVSENYQNGNAKEGNTGITKGKYPKSILTFSNAARKGKLHPQQKPQELYEWLIKTFSNQGEVILDNCCGSGTIGAACINTGRNYIAIEKDEHYWKLACERVQNFKAS